MRWFLSLNNEPSGILMGAPLSLPTPKMESLYWVLASCFFISSSWVLSIPSVIRTMLPVFAWPFSNKICAACIAARVLLPGIGISSGFSAGARARMVWLSSVRGETIWASPLNTTSPVTPSSLRFKISLSLCLARARREGLMSSANMERDKSRIMTCASIRFSTGWGSFCHAGPASAMMARIHSAAKK